ncbi:MAG: hypothetical protein WCL02_05555 [bacterium]
MNIGKKEPKNTIKYAELSHNPNIRIAIGIRAIGGIGLTNSTIFFKKEICLTCAIKKPIDTHIKIAVV